MEKKILNISPSDYGKLIGKKGRNIHLINHVIQPGRLNLRDNQAVLVGPLENKQWKQRTIRMIRSARRGGIIKWYDVAEREKLNQDMHTKWLKKIRNAESLFHCEVVQMEHFHRGHWYEVWVILEDRPTAQFEHAIEEIGKIIHRRYRLRKKNGNNSSIYVRT